MIELYLKLITLVNMAAQHLPMSNQISVIIPNDLRSRAKQAGINISEVCRRALIEELKTRAGCQPQGGPYDR